MLSIVKQLDSSVQIVRAGVVLMTLAEVCTMNVSTAKKGITVVDEYSRGYFLQHLLVSSHQILPAAAIPFDPETQSLKDLWTILVNDFFDELHTSVSGGGGVIESNITTTSGNYNILSTDYIIVANGNGNFRLPTINTNYGMLYRIFANNNTVNVLCDDPAGDRIIGQISVTLKKYDSASFRAVGANNWLIGD